MYYCLTWPDYFSKGRENLVVIWSVVAVTCCMHALPIYCRLWFSIYKIMGRSRSRSPRKKSGRKRSRSRERKRRRHRDSSSESDSDYKRRRDKTYVRTLKLFEGTNFFLFFFRRSTGKIISLYMVEYFREY